MRWLGFAWSSRDSKSRRADAGVLEANNVRFRALITPAQAPDLYLSRAEAGGRSAPIRRMPSRLSPANVDRANTIVGTVEMTVWLHRASEDSGENTAASGFQFEH